MRELATVLTVMVIVFVALALFTPFAVLASAMFAVLILAATPMVIVLAVIKSLRKGNRK